MRWHELVDAVPTEPDLDRYWLRRSRRSSRARTRGRARLLGTGVRGVHAQCGLMAQQAALRSWVERSSTDGVAVHGLSHLVLHERDALAQLHHLRVQHLTDEPRPATVADLDDLAGPLAVVSLELPLRDAGYLLPSWEELVAFTSRARERGVPIHLDGARLWESQPFYDRPHAEIAGLFDSVYVSFYKGWVGWPVLPWPAPATLSLRPGDGRPGTAAPSCSRSRRCPTPSARRRRAGRLRGSRRLPGTHVDLRDAARRHQRRGLRGDSAQDGVVPCARPRPGGGLWTRWTASGCTPDVPRTPTRSGSSPTADRSLRPPSTRQPWRTMETDQVALPSWSAASAEVPGCGDDRADRG